MTTRDRLHRLVDVLPEDALDAVARVLEALILAGGGTLPAE